MTSLSAALELESSLRSFDLPVIPESPANFSFPHSTTLDEHNGPTNDRDSYNLSTESLLESIPTFGANSKGQTKFGNITGAEKKSRIVASSKLQCPTDYTFDNGVTLVWRDLTVELGGRKLGAHKAIQGVTGYIRPGTLLGILGPSGAGKSALLQALAGKLPRDANTYGEILVNGHPDRLKYGLSVLIRSEDEFIETLTVRETLYYAALLQLPDQLPRSEKVAYVDTMISEMALEDLAGVRMGRLNVGRRRRTSIAMQLLTRPWLVFLEESIHYLDSASSFVIMRMLKKLTVDGCTVITSHKQMSSEAFHLLDKVCLLSCGRTIFFGRSFTALEHYATVGLPCPPEFNPADHLLQAINKEFGRINAPLKYGQESEHGDGVWFQLDTNVTVRTLENLYQTSGDAALVQSMASHLSEKEAPRMGRRVFPSSFVTLGIMTWRTLVNMWRDFRYFWLRLILSSLLAVCVGSVYCNTGDSYSFITARAVSIYVFVSSLSWVAIVGFSSIVQEIVVNSHERDIGYSGIMSYTLANLLSSSLFIFLISSSSAVGGYFLLGLHNGLGVFFYFVVNLFLCFTVMESLMLFVASILPNMSDGIVVLLMAQAVTTVVSGFYLVQNDMPTPFWKYPLSYISFQMFAVEGLLQNEYNSRMFSKQSQHTTELGTMNVSYEAYQAPLKIGKWRNLLVLCGMALSYRILACIAMFLVRYTKWQPRSSKYIP